MFDGTDGRHDAPRGRDFHSMPLAVLERQRVAVVTVAVGNREYRSRVQSAGDQHDGFGRAHRPGSSFQSSLCS